MSPRYAVRILGRLRLWQAHRPRPIVASVTRPLSAGELFELATGGDDEAWTELVDRLSPAIWSAARSCGLNRAQAEDVFGTVWLRLLDRRETIRDPERLPGWLYTTARHEALAILRTSNRFRDEDLERYAATPDAAREKLEGERTNELLWDALNGLDERCRQLLRLLTTVPKVPYKVVSDHMDMAVGSIGPTRDRCLRKLRAMPQVVEIMEAAT